MKVTHDSEILKISVSYVMKLIGYAIGFGIIGALLTAWVISTIIISVRDHIPSRSNEEEDEQRPSKTRRLKIEMLRAIVWICTMLLNVSEAQFAPPLADSASDTVLSLKSSSASIWRSGIGDEFNPSAQSITLSIGAG
jgi:hypothetical protein